MSNNYKNHTKNNWNVHAHESVEVETMQEFTVIGFWEDTGQRFSYFIKAEGADQAEELVKAKFADSSDLKVVAVIEGYHKPKETATRISETTKRGIPYTVSEVRKVTETQSMDRYHKELMVWLCDEVDRLT